MPRHRRRPRLGIKLPAGVELLLDLLAQRRVDVLLELVHIDVAVAIGVERLEHRLVHVALLAAALLQPERTEGARELVDVELAVAVGVELLEDLAHVPPRVARARGLPRGAVELPPPVQLCLDLAARLRIQAGLQLLEGDEAVAVGVERFEHLVVHLEFGAVALGQAERAEGARKLPYRELSVAVRVEVAEHERHVPPPGAIRLDCLALLGEVLGGRGERVVWHGVDEVLERILEMLREAVLLKVRGRVLHGLGHLFWARRGGHTRTQRYGTEEEQQEERGLP